jgi:D-aminopeptidase
VAQVVEQPRVVDGEDVLVGMRLGVDERRVPGAQRVPDPSARRGTSVPGVRTPIHTSTPGSCRRCRSLQTIGSASLIGREPIRAARRGGRSHDLGSWAVADASGTERGPAPTGGAGSEAGAPGGAGAGPRDLGIRIGDWPAGPANAITDVGGVRVGHVTVVRDEPPPPGGRGVGRTGVTVVAPRPSASLLGAPVPAGAAVLNGAGEMTGFLQVSEWGVLETPVYLTATMAVGRVYDGAVAAAAAADPAVGREAVVIPIVAECDDSWVSDAIPVQVEAADVAAALADAGASAATAAASPTVAAPATAGGPVAQGAVGAGTGMVCFDWKGGIGTSSRVVADLGATVGVLVLANFGAWGELRVDGVAVGRALGPPRDARSIGAPPAGSCIVVVATDAPLSSAQLARLARRAGLGLARTGSVAHHGSGEIFMAFAAHDSPGDPPARGLPDGELNALFACVVEATEEAVLNALWFARDTDGRDGRLVRALPHDDVLAVLAAHGRLER